MPKLLQKLENIYGTISRTLNDIVASKNTLQNASSKHALRNYKLTN